MKKTKERNYIVLKVLGGVVAICLIAYIMFWLIAWELASPNSSPPSPSRFGQAKWISKNPDICFETGEEENVWNGTIISGEKKYPCKISKSNHAIYFWTEDVDIEDPDYENDLLFWGDFWYWDFKDFIFK